MFILFVYFYLYCFLHFLYIFVLNISIFCIFFVYKPIQKLCKRTREVPKNSDPLIFYTALNNREKRRKASFKEKLLWYKETSLGIFFIKKVFSLGTFSQKNFFLFRISLSEKKKKTNNISQIKKFSLESFFFFCLF